MNLRAPEPKPLFLERMAELLPDEKDFEKYLEIIKIPLVNSIRVNTIKISVDELKSRLEDKGWLIEQLFPKNPEIMIIKGKKVGTDILDLEPGELGRSLEHLLGYYYVQEIVSMLPVIALNPRPSDTVLDIAAAPGSKTTQISAHMKNQGTIIANDLSLPRLKILASNLERCGAANVIITRKDGISLCRRFKDAGLEFDKILVDAPCSGEGTLRGSPKTAIMWNPNTIRAMSKMQKALLAGAIEVLKPKGELIYSTCTHAPEENEEILDYVLNTFKGRIKIESLALPISCRPGMTEWRGKSYNKAVESACRIYPQDNNTEGFFLAKIKKIK